MQETEKTNENEPQKKRRKPPTKLNYEDQMLLLECEGYARDGYDDQQIAGILGVDECTFNKKKNKKQVDGSDSLLKQALTRGRRPLEVLVENSLYKRSMGMKVTKTKTIKKMEWNPEKECHEWVVYEETEITELPPDVNAMNLWLRNRKPDFWNTQATKLDHTTNGKDLPENKIPVISEIQHVQIEASQVDKVEADT